MENNDINNRDNMNIQPDNQSNINVQPDNQSNINVQPDNQSNINEINTSNNMQMQSNATSNNNNTANKKKTSPILIAVIIVIGLFIVIKLFGGNNGGNNTLNNNYSGTTNSTNNESIYATVSGKNFQDAMDNKNDNYYMQFIGKRITITDLELDKNLDISYDWVTITCDNESSLSLDGLSTFSITGTVGTFTSNANISLSNCKVN